MKKLSYLLFTSLLVLVASCTPKAANQQAEAEKPMTDPMALYAQIDASAAPNTLTDKEKSEGWQLLFDGTTTNGWRGYNMKSFPDCWAIEDACLTMNSKGFNEDQDIITDKKYKSFALTVEYKITEQANSGVIYQVKEDSIYKFPYETGTEMQIIDEKNWKEKLEDWQTSGANYAMYPPIAKPAKPVGEWNRLMIVANNDSVTHILNGEIVVTYVKHSDDWNKLRNSGKWANFPDYGKFDEGNISLQNHGSKVWFRNVMIKEF